MDKGKLVVSTKTQRKIALGHIIGALAIFLAVIMLARIDSVQGSFEETFGEFGKVLAFLVPVLVVFVGVGCFMGCRSYCDVYENAVVGTTSLNFSRLNSTMRSFEIPFKDILGVTELKNGLCIHTQYGEFEALAPNRRAEAVAAIRARIGVKTP